MALRLLNYFSVGSLEPLRELRVEKELVMQSKARFLGHPIHQMLVVFPLGLLATAVIFDLITLGSGAPQWSRAAFYMIGAGIIGGLAAAIFGLIDWLAIPSDTRAK